MSRPGEPPDDGVREESGAADPPDWEGPDEDNLIVLAPFGGAIAEPPAEEATVASEAPSGPPALGQLEAAVEALLLAAAGPVSVTELEGWLQGPPAGEVLGCLYSIRSRLSGADRGVHLVEVAKGWQLRTDVRFAPWVAAMRGTRPLRLSRAALEVLAVVAYRQPVTRGEIDELRGVDSGGVLRLLTERGIVVVTGRRDEPGRPLLYGTSSEFLSIFGLRDLSDLPTLRDLREMHRGDEAGDEDEDALWSGASDAPDAWLRPRQEPLPLPPSLRERPTFGLPDPPSAGLTLPPDPDDP